jgi:1-phosphofructokinase family hexose kinase
LILTVTPNACVDKTYRVEGFHLDRVNRPSLTHTVAGGKGVNVARVYQRLGGVAVATGLLGGINGKIVARALAQEGIADEFVRIPGETRVCIAIIDPGACTQTEVNESGPTVTIANTRKLLRHVERLLSQRRYAQLVLSGSLPPGAPSTLYADLVEMARQARVESVVDTSGPALREALRARPWMVKPNRAELEALLDRPVEDAAATLEAALALHADWGVEVVAATRGADGAILVTSAGAWEATPPPIAFVSAVASGDSFTAAFLWCWNEGPHPHDAEQALRLATGAGAANAAVIGAGFCTRESIVMLAGQSQVAALDASGPKWSDRRF